MRPARRVPRKAWPSPVWAAEAIDLISGTRPPQISSSALPPRPRQRSRDFRPDHVVLRDPAAVVEARRSAIAGVPSGA
jgi:hypothetical protein